MLLVLAISKEHLLFLFILFIELPDFFPLDGPEVRHHRYPCIPDFLRRQEFSNPWVGIVDSPFGWETTFRDSFYRRTSSNYNFCSLSLFWSFWLNYISALDGPLVLPIDSFVRKSRVSSIIVPFVYQPSWVGKRSKSFSCFLSNFSWNVGLLTRFLILRYLKCLSRFWWNLNTVRLRSVLRTTVVIVLDQFIGLFIFFHIWIWDNFCECISVCNVCMNV